MYVCMHVHTKTIHRQRHTKWGKKVFIQLPSLEVMREVCNFHHRYTSTVRYIKCNILDYYVEFIKSCIK